MRPPEVIAKFDLDRNLSSKAKPSLMGPEGADAISFPEDSGTSGFRRLSPASKPRRAYRLRFATTPEQRKAAFRLRFQVFNLELNEGLDRAYWDGHDSDEFDSVCDHLAVEHVPSGDIVGTYRLQTGETAARHLGYYSAREFDFAPYEELRAQLVEVGRAAIRRDHRSFEVLTLLWRGIAEYASQRRARYLVGCSSITSQSAEEGSEMFHALESALIQERLRTVPLPHFAVPILAAGTLLNAMRPPKLLLSYLAIGANICGPPAIDREFKTIDFLTLLDLERLSPVARTRFFGPEVTGLGRAAGTLVTKRKKVLA